MQQTDFEQFTRYATAVRLLHMFMADHGTKEPLVQVIEATPEGINVLTPMDVSYASYSLRMTFPDPVLEIHYTDVKHSIVGDRWADIGDMWVQLSLQPGRVLHEMVKVERINKIEVIARVTEVGDQAAIG